MSEQEIKPEQEKETTKQPQDKDYQQLRQLIRQRQETELAPEAKLYWDKIRVEDLTDADLKIFYKLTNGSLSSAEAARWQEDITRERESLSEEEKSGPDKQQYLTTRDNFAQYIINKVTGQTMDEMEEYLTKIDEDKIF